ALIALQGVEDPTERRRQALRRGRFALDALEELKIGLLGGTLSRATLSKLQSAAGALAGRTGDAGLDSVLGEIHLRVDVEIAKMTPGWAPPGRRRRPGTRCAGGAGGALAGISIAPQRSPTPATIPLLSITARPDISSPRELGGSRSFPTGPLCL